MPDSTLETEISDTNESAGEHLEISETIPAEDYRLEGFLDVSDVADELEEMFYNGLEPGITTGWTNLDEFYRVQKKQWTVVTGTPNTGKSLWLDNLMNNLAEFSDWKFVVFSAENQPVKLQIKSLCEIYTNKRFSRFEMTNEEYCQALVFVQEHFRFANIEESEWTIDALLEKADAIRESGFDFDGLVIDPWNELEHRRPVAMSETEYISRALSRMRRYCRATDIHLWLIAHPTKLQKVNVKYASTDAVEEITKTVYPVPTLYDISGSAHFYNKADMGIVLWRDSSDRESPTKVITQKVRFRHCGRIGEASLWFDFVSTKFFEHLSERRNIA